MTPTTILATVATAFDLTVADLRGPRWAADIALARQVAAYVLKHRLPHLSQPRIGELLGRERQ